MAEACARLGYKFLRRFLREGPAGLRQQRRGPKGKPGRQRRHWQGRVLRLRRARPSWGARKLCWWLRQGYSGPGRIPCERTVQRWIGKRVWPACPARGRGRVLPAPGVRARVARCSNAVWTIDLKGWFRTGDGSKVEHWRCGIFGRATCRGSGTWPRATNGGSAGCASDCSAAMAGRGSCVATWAACSWAMGPWLHPAQPMVVAPGHPGGVRAPRLRG